MIGSDAKPVLFSKSEFNVSRQFELICIKFDFKIYQSMISISKLLIEVRSMSMGRQRFTYKKERFVVAGIVPHLSSFHDASN